MPNRPKRRGTKREAAAETSRPETPDLDAGVPLPDELTGRASKTNDDLASLFESESSEHISDGFQGGSGDDPEPIQPNPDERDA